MLGIMLDPSRGGKERWVRKGLWRREIGRESRIVSGWLDLRIVSASPST